MNTAAAISASRVQSDGTGEPAQVEIARALSAAPDDIAKAARVIGTDAKRESDRSPRRHEPLHLHAWQSKVIGEPPMCADAASIQWAADFKAHQPKPTNTVPGITYMLAGATQRSDSDPDDETSPAITVGPHWTIMWPFDPKATGLPTTHKPNGAYIMWAGSPYAHLDVMGLP